MSEKTIQEAVAKLTTTLVNTQSAEIIESLTNALTTIDDPDIRAGVLQVLRQLDRPECTDVVCRLWAETRHPELEALMVETGWTAETSDELAVLTVLKAGQISELTDSPPQRIGILLKATQDADAVINQNARIVLESLTRPASREELCRLVIEEDNAPAAEIAVAAGYAPRSPETRALFYLLTEQWQAYEALDFDASLLKVVYEAGDESLRRRIAEFARQGGRVEFVQVVAGSRHQRRLSDITSDEWHIVLSLLGRHRRGEHMWQLAQVAPPTWSSRLLQQMHALGIEPEATGEKEGWQELSRLADACTGPRPPLGGLARLHKRFLGHTGKIWDVAFGPALHQRTNSDSNAIEAAPTLISASKDGTIRFWRFDEDEVIRTLAGHTDSIEHLEVVTPGSPQGISWLVSSGDNWQPKPTASEAVQLWEMSDGFAVTTLNKCGPAFAVARQETRDHNDTFVLITGGKDGSVRWWSLPKGRALRRSRHHKQAVNRLVTSPDGQLLVSGSEDSTLHLWQVEDGTALARLSGHKGAIWDVAISSDSRLVASASHDHTIRLWTLPDGSSKKVLAGHEHGVSNLLIIPGNATQVPGTADAGAHDLLISASTDNSIRFWQLPDGKPLASLSGRGPVSASPDGRILAGRGISGEIWLWQLPDGLPLKTLDTNPLRSETLVASRAVTCIKFSPDGQWLANGCNDGSVWLWTSDLLRLCATPIPQTSVADIQWAQEVLATGGMTAEERAWCEFVLALMRWRRRYDIALEDLPTHIAIGEFDIEIEQC